MSELEPPPVRLLIVRHGQQERQGDDGLLTRVGRRQAAAAAAAIGLSAEDRLVASTLRRAVETATAFGRAPEQFGALDEFRFGPAWSWDQADEGASQLLWRPEDRLPGGESLREFELRVQHALGELVREPPDGRLVVVVHSGVIDALLRWAFGTDPDEPWTTEASAGHTSITELHHWPRGRRASGAPRHTLLVRLGDVAHLPPDLVTGR